MPTTPSMQPATTKICPVTTRSYIITPAVLLGSKVQQIFFALLRKLSGHSKHPQWWPHEVSITCLHKRMRNLWLVLLVALIWIISWRTSLRSHCLLLTPSHLVSYRRNLAWSFKGGTTVAVFVRSRIWKHVALKRKTMRSWTRLSLGVGFLDINWEPVN